MIHLKFPAALALSIALSSALTPHAIAKTATLRIRGDALVFDGVGLQAPDAEGHFAIGARLPLPRVKALNCETPYLILGLGSLNKPENQLTEQDHALIDKNKAYWEYLRGLAELKTPISIRVSNNCAYLKVVSGGIIATYCTLSIDQGAIK